MLQKLGAVESSLQLSDTHMRAMFTAIDADENGFVDWFEMVSFICDAIEHIEREAYITGVSQPSQPGRPAAGGEEEGGEDPVTW